MAAMSDHYLEAKNSHICSNPRELQLMLERPDCIGQTNIHREFIGCGLMEPASKMLCLHHKASTSMGLQYLG